MNVVYRVASRTDDGHSRRSVVSVETVCMCMHAPRGEGR